MTADSPIHGSAMLQMNSGKILSGSPCLGSWVNYGLGSENENLPGFVVMLDPRGGPISGAKNWSSGYMPAISKARSSAAAATPILDLRRPAGMTRAGTARAARHAARVQRRSLRPVRRQHGAGRAHRQLRAGVQDAEHCARGGRSEPGNRRDARSCTA